MKISKENAQLVAEKMTVKKKNAITEIEKELSQLAYETAKASIKKDVFDGNIEHLVKLQNEIVDELRSEILIRPKIELVEPGTLPISEGKAKRVIDKRKL